MDPMKIDMYLPCMLQNKVCLEDMLKMAPSSIQAPFYASLQIGKDTCQCDIGNGSNLPPYHVFEGVSCWRRPQIFRN
jgi:hypothetical protein